MQLAFGYHPLSRSESMATSFGRADGFAVPRSVGQPVANIFRELIPTLQLDEDFNTEFADVADGLLLVKNSISERILAMFQGGCEAFPLLISTGNSGYTVINPLGAHDCLDQPATKHLKGLDKGFVTDYAFRKDLIPHEPVFRYKQSPRKLVFRCDGSRGYDLFRLANEEKWTGLYPRVIWRDDGLPVPSIDVGEPFFSSFPPGDA